MVILDHIEKIVEISQTNGIDKCYRKGKRHFDFISAKLGINPVQAVIFSHFMEKCDDHHIQISEIAESLKCSKVRILKYMNECDELERKKLIRCSRGNDGISYRVPRGVCESLRKHNEYKPERYDNLHISKLFTNFERIFEERSNNELTSDSMHLELHDLVNQNMHLLFCQKLNSYKFNTDNFVLLICFCHLFANNNDDNIGSHDIKFLYDDKSDYYFSKKYLTDGSHTLIESKFVEHNNNNGFVNSDSWKLSDIAKKELLSELTISQNKNYKKNLILFDSIKHKKMYYNKRETGEIEKLMSLLQEENFCKIQDRLDGKGMRKGFACLFSGPPGTGKTETA